MSHLVDASAKEYLLGTLHKCHDIRVRYYSVMLNVGVFLGFVCIVGSVLYYCYITKLSPKDTTYKIMKDQDYILSKIRFYQEQQSRINESAASYSTAITDLPVVPPSVVI